MASISYSFVFFFCILLDWNRVFGQQLYNVTVDDNNSAIQYSGDWRLSLKNELDEGWYHMFTQDPNAEAVFRFTGVAIYFLSPLWPYDVTTQVQLDAGPLEILNLRDFDTPKTADDVWETVGSRVVWGIEGLENKSHELKITMAAGHRWAIVDGLIFTAVDSTVTSIIAPSPITTLSTNLSAMSEAATVTSSTPSTSSTLGPSTQSSRSGDIYLLVIGVGAGIGFLLLVALLLTGCLSWYRRPTTQRHPTRVDLEKEFPPTPKPVPVLSTPSHPPGPNTNPSAVLRSASTVSSASHQQCATQSRTPQQLVAPPPAQSIEREVRPTTLDRPPPGYYDYISVYDQSRASRWACRLSVSALRNSRFPPPTSSNSRPGGQVHLEPPLPSWRNKW